MPPKVAKTQRKGAASGDICSICCQKIGPKDEVLFCSGSCQKHLHRYCASVSEQCYKTLTSDGAPPFLCFCCFRAQKDEEVAKLQGAVDLLMKEIKVLKASKQRNDDQCPSLVATSAGQPTEKKSFSSIASGEPTASLAPPVLFILCLMSTIIKIVNIMWSFMVWRSAAQACLDQTALNLICLVLSTYFLPLTVLSSLSQ